MNIQFSDRAWEDYTHWQQYDRKIVKKINALLADIDRDRPYEGIGKPEPLKHAFSGFWSRRITDEHRLNSINKRIPATARRQLCK